MELYKIKQELINNPPMIIALGGEERGLVLDALDIIRENILVAKSKLLNHHIFNANQCSLLDIVNSLNIIPFFNDKRLIEIHDAQFVDDNITEMIIDYSNNPAKYSCLVLVFSKIDKRNKLISFLISHDYFYLFDNIFHDDIIKMIINRAKSYNMALSKDSAAFLSMILDKNFLSIKTVIDQLSLLFENQEITINDIEKHVCSFMEQDVFLLSRYVSEGDIPNALYHMGLIRNSHENALKLLGVLIWQFRVIVTIRYGLEKGMGDHEIAKLVSVYKERYRWMSIIAKKKTMPFHIKRLLAFGECDKLIKSINTKYPFNIIEKVIYQNAMGM